MSINDEIGGMSGSQSHLWGGERTQKIVAANQLSDSRGPIQLDREVGELYPEVAAAEIARNIYGDGAIEFRTSALHLAHLRANIAAYAASNHDLAKAYGIKKSETEFKPLVDSFGQDDETVSNAQVLGWLSYAFDAGAYPGDLVAWGVDKFLVIQLQWWQRREGESLLNQHIRALRNGWALPWLSQAARANYANLIRIINRGGAPDEFLAAHEAQLNEVRELLSFFGELDLPDGSVNEPTRLDDARAIEWAKAFGENIAFIAPDAQGRWGMLPPVGLKKGELRGCAEPVARYLDQLGFNPSDVGTKLTQEFFGRVGDETA